MSCLKIVSVVLSVIVSGSLSSGELSCGPNEVVDDCPSDCAYNYCPKDQYHDRTPCPKSKICPPPACKCGFNYRRADNGTCIPTRECPPFECSGINEEFNPCPSYCPSDNCRDASLSGECPYFLLIVVACSPTCRCIKHHWRNDGICVPYKECPDS
ncbi:inducible metalloproteinase inhibitor protein-like [Melitaea cinxia]|uniref:inducible metalloproteinase inhibitor protein-like n=1 Tax=Melitaea cinxia TaxID=113334 RepID=UPI001E26F77A|nr:inducible metalloproteinase inhibitor protein-like [Melitaea cinxia]